MKTIQTISLFAAALFLAGCASSTDSASEGNITAIESNSSTTSSAKTAYEGSTGSGLLMERYKSGEIDGYRN